MKVLTIGPTPTRSDGAFMASGVEIETQPQNLTSALPLYWTALVSSWYRLGFLGSRHEGAVQRA